MTCNVRLLDFGTFDVFLATIESSGSLDTDVYLAETQLEPMKDPLTGTSDVEKKTVTRKHYHVKDE